MLCVCGCGLRLWSGCVTSLTYENCFILFYFQRKRGTKWETNMLNQHFICQYTLNTYFICHILKSETMGALMAVMAVTHDSLLWIPLCACVIALQCYHVIQWLMHGISMSYKSYVQFPNRFHPITSYVLSTKGRRIVSLVFGGILSYSLCVVT